jgi:hypothetical protein
VYALKKGDLMPLVDTVADRLPSWKVNLMSRVGRTTLNKVMLSAIPIHISIAVEVSPWILQAIDKVRRLRCIYTYIYTYIYMYIYKTKHTYICIYIRPDVD